MFKRQVRWAMRVAAVGLLAAVPLWSSAASRADEPGVTDKTIKIGILGSLTGPLAVFGTGKLAGATLAFKDANAAGRVNGRKREWLPRDGES